MKPDPRDLLYDVALSARQIFTFLKEKRFADYASDGVLRSAVERQLGKISETLARLELDAPQLASLMTDWRAFADLRMDLHRGPTKLDDRLLFSVATEEIPRLSREVDALLADTTGIGPRPQSGTRAAEREPEVRVACFREILFVPLVFSDLTPENVGDKAEGLSRKCAKALEDSKIWKSTRKSLDCIDDYAEWAYLLPHARTLLYSADYSCRQADLAAILSKEISGQIKIKCFNEKTGNYFAFFISVEQCYFYIFKSGICILVLELVLDPTCSGSAFAPVSDVIAFIDRFRRTYPPFWRSTTEPGSFPSDISWVPSSAAIARPTFEAVLNGLDVERGDVQPAAFWQQLLEPLVFGHGQRFAGAPEALRVRQVLDDRCPYMAFLATPDIDRLSDGDMYRLAFADPPGEGDPVSARFLDEFRAKNCYDRFWPMPALKTSTRYVCSGHGFCAIGSSESDYFLKIVQMVFRRQYRNLALLIHFQHASLVQAQTWLARLLPTLRATDDNGTKAAANVLRSILSFVGPDWLQTASNQLQARELVFLWQTQLGIQETHREVRDTARDLYDLVSAERSAEINDAAVRIGLISIVGVALALFTGFLGINVLVDGYFGVLCPKAWATALFALSGSLLVGSILTWWFTPKTGAKDLFRWLRSRLLSCGLGVLCVASVLWFMGEAGETCGVKNDTCAPAAAGSAGYGSCIAAPQSEGVSK